jgi:5-methylcytosine-specific restriction endonuclease McrA
MYTYDNIEVNHIIPINEDIDKALDDDNLICLCSHHHKMADKEIIPRSIMLALARPKRDLERIRQEVAEP